jgi:hypothetical protein
MPVLPKDWLPVGALGDTLIKASRRLYKPFQGIAS